MRQAGRRGGRRPAGSSWPGPSPAHPSARAAASTPRRAQSFNGEVEGRKGNWDGGKGRRWRGKKEMRGRRKRISRRKFREKEKEEKG